jgi:hypothetical protein
MLQRIMIVDQFARLRHEQSRRKATPVQATAERNAAKGVGSNLNPEPNS